MSWKNAEHGVVSVRGRLMLSIFLSSGLIALVVSAIVLFASYRHMIGQIDRIMNRLSGDLQAEYRALGGATEEFRKCVEEDAAEHDKFKTFILVVGTDNQVVLSTDMPVGFHSRLLHQMETRRYAGRFYTERGEVEHVDRGAVRYVSLPLYDGSRVIVARDVSQVEEFLIFLAATLGGGTLLIIVLSCLSGFVIGERILKLNKLVEEKETAYGELRRLTDDIAHDLRTPLTRLSMAAETQVSGGDLREPLSEMVVSETRNMLELINTMLDLSQTEAKIDRTPRENLNLTNFVHDICDLYSAIVEDNGLTLETSVPNVPVWFSGHKGKLQQLLANLIENAIKFTAKGGKISVALSTSASSLDLSVSDTGCGIASEDIPFVFKRFWRADSSRHLPGNGLGLALVQAIATSYGGTATCVSRLGSGTRFLIKLPL